MLRTLLASHLSQCLCHQPPIYERLFWQQLLKDVLSCFHVSTCKKQIKSVKSDTGAIQNVCCTNLWKGLDWHLRSPQPPSIPIQPFPNPPTVDHFCLHPLLRSDLRHLIQFDLIWLVQLRFQSISKDFSYLFMLAIIWHFKQKDTKKNIKKTWVPVGCPIVWDEAIDEALVHDTEATETYNHMDTCCAVHDGRLWLHSMERSWDHDMGFGCM